MDVNSSGELFFAFLCYPILCLRAEGFFAFLFVSSGGKDSGWKLGGGGVWWK